MFALLQSLMACILRGTMVSECEQGNVGWPSTWWRGGWWGWGSRAGLHAVRHHGRADRQTATAGLWPQLSAQDEHQTYLTVSHAQQDEHQACLTVSQFTCTARWTSSLSHSITCTARWTSTLSHSITCTARWTSTLSHGITCTDQNYWIIVS